MIRILISNRGKLPWKWLYLQHEAQQKKNIIFPQNRGLVGRTTRATQQLSPVAHPATQTLYCPKAVH